MEEEENKSLFKKTLNTITTNQQNRLEGIYNSIPFGLPSLDKHIPGIMKGVHYCITAATGAGKTKLTKFLFVLQAYKFIKAHPDLGITLKIIYFALEESKEDFMLDLICNRLKEEYGITTDSLKLKSMGENTLSPEILERVKLCAEYFEDLEKYLEIVDEIYNPTGAFFHCRNYATNNGLHYYRKLADKTPKDEDTINHIQYNNLDDTTKKLYCYYRYIPSNPKEFVLVISDHVGLWDIEATPDGNTKHLILSKWSTDYARKMLVKRYNYCVVDVHQSQMDGEKQQYSFSGESVISKLLPSLDKLGDNKTVGRNYMVVLGLFAPERYQIPEYLGYDISKLKDNGRFLNICKNRYGTPNLHLPLYFNGATTTFAELPNSKSEDMKRIYTALETSRRTSN